MSLSTITSLTSRSPTPLVIATLIIHMFVSQSTSLGIFNNVKPVFYPKCKRLSIYDWFFELWLLTEEFIRIRQEIYRPKFVTSLLKYNMLIFSYVSNSCYDY